MELFRHVKKYGLIYAGVACGAALALSFGAKQVYDHGLRDGAEQAQTTGKTLDQITIELCDDGNGQLQFILPQFDTSVQAFMQDGRLDGISIVYGTLTSPAQFCAGIDVILPQEEPKKQEENNQKSATSPNPL